MQGPAVTADRTAFSSELLEDLAADAEVVSLDAGNWLYHQGDLSKDIYIVRSGRLEVVREPSMEVINLLTAGAVLGELAPLTAAPRSAGIRARRDSTLIRVSGDEFVGRLEKDASSSLRLSKSLAHTLQHPPLPERQSDAAAVVALLPVNIRAVPKAIRRGFEELVGHLRSVAVFEGVPDTAGASEAELLSDVGAKVDQAEQAGKFVVLLGHGGLLDSLWNRFCIRQADRVVMVTDASKGIPVGGPGLESSDVVFVGRPTPSELTRWLDHLRPRSHVVAFPGDGNFGLASLVRRLLGKSTGLVLAGGGARNFAHIGVIDVLVSEGFAIDRIGGCSIGSVIGALFSLGVSPSEIREILHDFLVRRDISYRTAMALMMLPLNLLLKPEEHRTLYGTLQQMYGDALIEELPIPLYTNTSDLGSGDIQIVHRGPLWEAVALSMTIPIVLPPRPIDGRLLVDGGILEPFPVRPMADERAGPIIGVAGASSDVTPIGADEPTLELRGTPDARASLPSTIETLLRVMDLVSYNCAGVRTNVDVYITPDVGRTGITEFSRLDEMIEAGRVATRRALDEQDCSGFAKRFPGEPSQVTWLLDAVEERRPAVGLLGRAAEAIDRGLLEGRGRLSAASGRVGSAFGNFGGRRAPSVSSILDGLITEILRIPH